MFDELQLAQLRERLLGLQRELMAVEKSSTDATKTVELDPTSVGRLSRMDALQGQAMSLELEHRRQLQLTNIVAALQRLDKGDYGYCLDCDEEIETKRLQHDPAITRCVRCAQKKEQA